MRNRIAVLAVLVLLGGQFVGCSDDTVGEFGPNRSPDVWLSAAPPEGTVSEYTLHLFWGGWDPDGEIAFYEFIMTDNETGVFDPADTTTVPGGESPWRPVLGTDSIFVFSADTVLDSTQLGEGGDPNVLEAEEFRRTHTFFIRAVDEVGARTKVPAYRSFTSRTLSPTVTIQIPSLGASVLDPARVPPITTFKWTATDFIGSETEKQDPESVRTIIVPTSKFGIDNWNDTQEYIRRNPDAAEWLPWRSFKAPNEAGKEWTTPALDGGTWVFAVQVKDEAGAVTPVFDLKQNMRRMRVGNRTGGPQLFLQNEFIGTVLSTTPTSNPVILSLPASVPLQFCFRADASSYGGTVSGYRFGWDIQDLNDDEQWEVDFTPFLGDPSMTQACSSTRTFFFGQHRFDVEVVDNSGFITRASAIINVIDFTFTRDILLVDDWNEGNGSWGSAPAGRKPSDLEHDTFWLDILDNVSTFSPVQDVFAVGPGNLEVPIEKVADYKNIIWLSSASPTEASISEMIGFKDPNVTRVGGRTVPNIPGLFMAAGGHLLLAGENVLNMVINEGSFVSIAKFPIIFRYELGGDQDGVYTSGGNDVGVIGVGETSFGYQDCCVNVIDIAQTPNPNLRRDQNNECDVAGIRNGRNETLRAAIPADLTTGPGFPRLELRPEVSDVGKFFHASRRGLDTNTFNPFYFSQNEECSGVVEYPPDRSCFQPIYTLECLDQNSVNYNQTIAFWTSRFANRIDTGVAARSAVFGFHPVMFKPSEVETAIGVILFDEWQLPQN